MLKFLAGWLVGMATIPAVLVVGIAFGAGHLGDVLQRHALTGSGGQQAQVKEAVQTGGEADQNKAWRICLDANDGNRDAAYECLTDEEDG